MLSGSYLGLSNVENGREVKQVPYFTTNHSPTQLDLYKLKKRYYLCSTCEELVQQGNYNKFLNPQCTSKATITNAICRKLWFFSFLLTKCRVSFTSGSISTFLPAASSKEYIFIIADTAYAFQEKNTTCYISWIKFKSYEYRTFKKQHQINNNKREMSLYLTLMLKLPFN